MNEQLQKALADLVLKMTDAVNTAQGMLPELVRQLVGWNILKGFIWLGFGTIGMVLGVILMVWVGRHDDTDEVWGWGILGFLLACAGFGAFADSTLDLVQLYNYPQTWVLEYLKGMAH